MKNIPGCSRRIEIFKRPKPLRADGTVDEDAPTEYSERSVYDAPENLADLEETVGTHNFIRCLDDEEYGRMLESVGVIPDFSSALSMSRDEARGQIMSWFKNSGKCDHYDADCGKSLE